jgi:hypothetical protein
MRVRYVPGIQEDSVAAHRLHDGNVPLGEQLAEVAHLADRGDRLVVVLHRLLDAEGERFHVTPGHAAVGVQPFVDHDHVAGAPRRCLAVVHGQPAADVDQVILLGELIQAPSV